MNAYARGYRAALCNNNFDIEGNNLAALAGVEYDESTPTFLIWIGIAEALKRSAENDASKQSARHLDQNKIRRWSREKRR